MDNIWKELVERKNEFIGRTMTEREYGSSNSTKIKDIELKENDSWFQVRGEKFDYGFKIEYGGFEIENGEPTLTFMYGGKLVIED